MSPRRLSSVARVERAPLEPAESTSGTRTACHAPLTRDGRCLYALPDDVELPIVNGVAVVDEYFESLDADTRAAFEHIRTLALDIVPDAEQGTSYGMAALKYKEKPLLGFAAAKRHLSIFPFSPQAVDGVRDRLSGYELSKGTIRFTVDKPLADDVIRDVVMLRKTEIVG
jgi:uncharacterized protein YdhG (YjbR/CyaY superfamily)